MLYFEVGCNEIYALTKFLQRNQVNLLTMLISTAVDFKSYSACWILQSVEVDQETKQRW